MRRARLLLSLLLVLSLASLAWAQEASDQGGASAAELAPDESAEVTAVTLSGAAVASLAQAVSTRLGDSGSLPEWGRVTLASGTKQQFTAADMFVLFCRAAQGWYENGALPASISITPGSVDPPRLDEQDYPDPQLDLEKGRELSTDQFLSVAGETRRWMEKAQSLPKAVWVGGERLSAAEYMGGLAICVEYAAKQGQLEDTIFLPDYSPPLSWAEHSDLLAETASEANGGGQGTTGEAPASRGMTPPLLDVGTSAQRVAKPQVTLYPAGGSKVAGRVDLVVNYSGPPASFITFAIDGKTRAIMNTSPYGYRWNTAEQAPGKHQVTVRAFVENSVEVAAAEATYVVAAPQPTKASPSPKPKTVQKHF
jgi:hypothetical protein